MSEDNQSNVTIYEAVEKRYTEFAGGDPDGCCGDDCNCTSEGIYDADMLDSLPVDVTKLSLGCGDPVTLAALQPGERVLDLGSGGGIDCFLAARQVGEEGYVIGVDMTQAMLDKANANKAQAGLTNVEFRYGHIESLPVESDSIDIVMSNCVINLSPDKASVFHEVLRALKPGGRVAISDIVTDGEFTPELRSDLAKWAECVVGAIDVEQYVGLMREAGFVDVEVIDKVDAEKVVPQQDGMPRVLSARITARKQA